MANEPMDDLEKTRRKLRFRAWHRGTREADLIMGQFADANIATMSPDELNQFDAILEAQDLDVYNWIIGKEPVPVEFQNDIMKQLLVFDFRLPGSGF
jgi:antitoxin CptB